MVYFSHLLGRTGHARVSPRGLRFRPHTSIHFWSFGHPESLSEIEKVKSITIRERNKGRKIHLFSFALHSWMKETAKSQVAQFCGCTSPVPFPGFHSTPCIPHADSRSRWPWRWNAACFHLTKQKRNIVADAGRINPSLVFNSERSENHLRECYIKAQTRPGGRSDGPWLPLRRMVKLLIFMNYFGW